MSDVADPEHRLDALPRHSIRDAEYAGVEDRDVHVELHPIERVGESTDGLERGQVQTQEARPRGWRARSQRPQLGRRALTLARIARGDDDLGPGDHGCARDGETDSGACPGDDDALPRQIGV